MNYYIELHRRRRRNKRHQRSLTIVEFSIVAFLLIVLMLAVAFSSPAQAVKMSGHSSEGYSTARATVHPLYMDGIEHAVASGVMVAPRLMLTAAHVLRARELKAGLKKASTKVLRSNEEFDLALLEVEMGCPCAMIASVTPERDAPVVLVGYPLNNAVMVQIATEGRAQGMVGRSLITTADIAFGSSGGGAFALLGGQWMLVGITVHGTAYCSPIMGCSMYTFLSHSVGVTTIREFMEARK